MVTYRVYEVEERPKEKEREQNIPTHKGQVGRWQCVVVADYYQELLSCSVLLCLQSLLQRTTNEEDLLK